jgi:NitT/TauT family transport system ATP-binding protein
MDEPFAALDALTRRRMHAVLTEIWQRTGKTIVFVTHDIAEAITLADRIGMMSVGPVPHRQDIRRRPAASARPPIRRSRLFHEIETLLEPDVMRSGSRR